MGAQEEVSRFRGFEVSWFGHAQSAVRARRNFETLKPRNLLLAARAVVRAAAANDNALDGRAADQAGFAFAPVNAVLELEKAGVAVCVDIVGNRGAAGGDGFVEDRLEPVEEALHLVAAHAGSAAARADAGAEQRLVGVDVAHAAQQLLVQERALHRRPAAAEQAGEEFESDVERLGSGGGESVAADDAQLAEHAGIDEAQLAPGGEMRDQVRVLFDGVRWLADQQPPGHAEMHDPLRRPGRAVGRFEVDDDVLAHAAHRSDALAGERARDLLRGRLERLAALADPDRLDRLADDAPGEAARDGFDFGKLRHKDSFQFRVSSFKLARWRAAI